MSKMEPYKFVFFEEAFNFNVLQLPQFKSYKLTEVFKRKLAFRRKQKRPYFLFSDHGKVLFRSKHKTILYIFEHHGRG